jgi:hypothetical protein
MKQIDYYVIEWIRPKIGEEWNEFEEMIRGKQKEGWCCEGNLTFDGPYVHQTMIKYEEQKPFVGVTEKLIGFDEPAYIPKSKKEPKPIDPECLSLVEYLIDLIKTIGESPNIKITEAQKNKWANEFRLMVDLDGFAADWIRATLKMVFEAPGSGTFAWKYVIRSAKKFREHVKAGKLDHLFAEKIRKGDVEPW